VWSSITLPRIIAVLFNDFIHYSKSSAKARETIDRSRDSLPYIPGYGPNSVITGNSIVEHLQQVRMVF
jgi:hypothetical protein